MDPLLYKIKQLKLSKFLKTIASLFKLDLHVQSCNNFNGYNLLKYLTIWANDLRLMRNLNY